MQGLLFETAEGARLVLRLLVTLLCFWTAWRSGRAAADGWSGYGTVLVYTLMLGFAARFLHFSLFQGPFISPLNYFVDTLVLLIFSTIGFRVRRTQQMVNNYYWLYEKTSPFSWKAKD
ncbi:hypothetical protein NOF55_06260 [Rhizobiaceae bacterium BDR2-2]|uniref:DUF6867 domain-containing protein n=1 Tax=Ectorhizobium quercum TaxID=2965071 RepID=A0AAE3MZ17_9HYPH|nr:hypothetical protein [Ectorhizobium quercum]MCX8996704.1 hypothetical protein [Ectorhizobium quercum]